MASLVETTVSDLCTLDRLTRVDDKFRSSAIVFAILANFNSTGRKMIDIIRLVPDTTDVNFALLQLDRLGVLTRPTLFTKPITLPKAVEMTSGKDERDDTNRVLLEHKHDTQVSGEYDPTWVLKYKSPFILSAQYWSVKPIQNDKLFTKLLRELAVAPVVVPKTHEQEPIIPDSAPLESRTDKKYDRDTVMSDQEPRQGHQQGHLDGQPSYMDIYSSTTKTPLPSTASWLERGKDDLLYRDHKTSVSIGHSTKLANETSDTTNSTRQENAGKPVGDGDVFNESSKHMQDSTIEAPATGTAHTCRPGPPPQPPLLVLRHTPLLDDDGVPMTRKNVAYVVRPMTYDEDASFMANEYKSRAETSTSTSTGTRQAETREQVDVEQEQVKVKDTDMHTFDKVPPETIYKPAPVMSRYPPTLAQKLDKLPVKTRIRLQMSMGYTAVFLVLAERKSRGVLLNEWPSLLPRGVDYCNGINLAQSAGLVTSAKHTKYLDDRSDSDKIVIPKLMLHQEHWNLDAQEAKQRVVSLAKLVDTMADMNMMIYTDTWDVDNSTAAPFTYRSKTGDPVPFQHTFNDCIVKDSRLMPHLAAGQHCKIIRYDRLVGLLRYGGDKGVPPL